MTIDYRLSFSDHVNQVVKKCSSMLYSLCKIRYLLNYNEAKLIYTSIIRPMIEYGGSILIDLPVVSSQKLEAIQNKAIKVICQAPSKFSVTDGRILLNLHTLCARRDFFFRSMVGKAQCALASDELRNLLDQVLTHKRTLRSGSNYVLPSANINFRKRRFTYNAIKLLHYGLCTDILSFDQ